MQMDVKIELTKGSPAPTQSARGYRVRRVVQWVQLGMLLLAGVYGFLGKPLVVAALIASALLLLVSHRLSRLERATAAADWMLGVLTLMTGLLAFMGQGLRDSALMVFPGLLVFAAMFGRRSVLLALLGTQELIVLGIWLANEKGWYRSQVGAAGFAQVLDFVLILTLTSLAVWLLSGDLYQAFLRIKDENRRARESIAQLQFNVRHDSLTGLPNRRQALELMDEQIMQGLESQGSMQVLLMNVDNFKSVNDALGTKLGDEFLKALSSRLLALQGAGEVLCRIGSDEFLIVNRHVPDRDQASARIAAWLAAADQIIVLGGIEIRITCSAGVAAYPDNAHSGIELLQRADVAMRRAKVAGRNTWRAFSQDMMTSEVDHLKLLADMRLALRQGDFRLHFQPKVELKTGRVVGAEALLRWTHPTRGVIPPAHFIPLAERSGLIVELGAWVLQEACRQARTWREAGWGDFCVAVNVSIVQFRRGDLEFVVAKALSDAGLPGSALELELTESLFADSLHQVETTLGVLRASGVQLAIDDFGTGYSNLGYLQRFEIQTLKIDQSFVRRLPGAEKEAALVGAIIDIASKLRLKTVAEGIESKAVADTLEYMGCQYGQGYYWSVPLPPEEFHDRFAPGQLLWPVASVYPPAPRQIDRQPSTQPKGVAC